MIVAFRVFVFAVVGYAIAEGAIWVCKATTSDSEKARIQLLPEDYILKNHKGLVALAGLSILCKATAIGALMVAAIMWVVGA